MRSGIVFHACFLNPEPSPAHAFPALGRNSSPARPPCGWRPPPSRVQSTGMAHSRHGWGSEAGKLAEGPGWIVRKASARPPLVRGRACHISAPGGVLSQMHMSQAARTPCGQSLPSVRWALRVPQGPVRNTDTQMTPACFCNVARCKSLLISYTKLRSTHRLCMRYDSPQSTVFTAAVVL